MLLALIGEDCPVRFVLMSCTEISAVLVPLSVAVNPGAVQSDEVANVERSVHMRKLTMGMVLRLRSTVAPRPMAITLDIAGVESVDLSYLVDGHLDYRAKLESVIEFLAFEE
jgi:hypothetical protein